MFLKVYLVERPDRGDPAIVQNRLVARTLLLSVNAVFGGAQRANNRELLLLLKGEPHPGGSIMVKNPESVLGKGHLSGKPIGEQEIDSLPDRVINDFVSHD